MNARILILAAAFLIAPPATHAEPVPPAGTADLRWKPKEGQSFIYELQQKSTNRTVVNPPAPTKTARPPKQSRPAADQGTIDSTLDQALTLELTVRSSDAELGSTVDLKITRVRATITTPDGTTKVDSDTPDSGHAADPIALALQAIAGTTLTLTVGPEGNITKSEGGGETLGLASLLGGAGGAVLPRDALGLITSSSSTPARAKVGQRWTTTSALAGSLLGDAAMTTTHTLKKLRGSAAEVDMQGHLEPSGTRREKADAPSLFQVTSAQIKGRYEWDTSAGWIRSMSTTQTTRIEAQGLSEALGESGTMESTSETTLSRVDTPTKPQR